jgi:hypothetical protein
VDSHTMEATKGKHFTTFSITLIMTTSGLPCKATHLTNLHIRTIPPKAIPRANTTLINHILGLKTKYSRVIQIHRIVAVMAATVVITLVVRTVVSLAKVRATHPLQPNEGAVDISATYPGLLPQEGEEAILPLITSLAVLWPRSDRL